VLVAGRERNGGQPAADPGCVILLREATWWVTAVDRDATVRVCVSLSLSWDLASQSLGRFQMILTLCSLVFVLVFPVPERIRGNGVIRMVTKEKQAKDYPKAAETLPHLVHPLLPAETCVHNRKAMQKLQHQHPPWSHV
jgi:hypothetical protein